MLIKSPDKLRADIQHYYGLNLDELGYAVRVRRMADLAANLPEQARTWAALDAKAAWDTHTYLLANAVDALNFLAWTKTRAAQKRGAKWKGQLPRPGMKQAHADDGMQALDIDTLTTTLNQPRTTT